MGLLDWFGDKRKPSVPDALWAQTVAALLDVSASRLTREELDRMSQIIERAKQEGR